MIKLEKEFIGAMFENCNELTPIGYKTLNSKICKNALFHETGQKLKG